MSERIVISSYYLLAVVLIIGNHLSA